MIIEAREDTITLRGAIQSNIWAAIQAAAALLLENHPTGIIIDCSALERITPKGAETFADASEYITEKNARIVVAGLAPELLEIGRSVAGVRSQLPVCNTVEEARASLKFEEIEPERGRAENAVVVPLMGDWKAALRHALRLAKTSSAEVHIVDLIRVPRTLPIGTPLPEREADGQQRLEESAVLLKAAGAKHFEHVERVRSKSEGLVDFVHKVQANFLVLSIDRGGKTDPHMDSPEAMALLEAADFEVSLVKGAHPDHEKPSVRVVIPAVGAWDHALEHACRLVSGDHAQVTVVSIITIPRAEPIDAPKPDAEVAASDAAKEAIRIARTYNVQVVSVVERVRDPILGFTKFVSAQGFDLAVVGVMRETTGDYHIAHSIADALLESLPCETVFLRTGK
ncbi:MAG: universal stress protein [Armatimonadetes bacterium]|nr:universal stress protein [Armatimonadota bacterium]